MVSVQLRMKPFMRAMRSIGWATLGCPAGDYQRFDTEKLRKRPITE
jgi:hypothetical protein